MTVRNALAQLGKFAVLGAFLLCFTSVSAPSASAQDGDWVEIGRGRNYIEYQQGSEFRQEIFGGPIFTQADNGDWVSYIFEDLGDRYVVQHPHASVKFFDYYTEVWTEHFENVLIYNDQWKVESWQTNKWKDVGFWGIVRSHEIVSDNEIRLIRAGETTIGQRREIYTFRRGSPVKIRIEQTCDSAQTIRFSWRPSGIVAATEKTHKDDENRKSHLAYYDNENDWVGTLAWFDELEVVENIDVVCDTHAQGRKATVTFGSFEVGGGGTAVLDPTETFYSTANDGYLWDYSASYSSAHDSSSAYDITSTTTTFTVGQKFTGTYFVYRGFVFFDTSSLPDNAVITSATLSLRGEANFSDDDFDVVVQIGENYDAENIYPHDPLQLGDYNYTHYSDNLGSFNTADFVNAYHHIALSDNADNWIDKQGITKFCLRSKNDIDSIPPTGYEYVGFSASEKSSQQPKLMISYYTKPLKALSPLCEDQTNPIKLTILTPRFNAIFNTDNASRKGDKVYIDVGTSENGFNMWSSGWTDITDIDNNTRSENVIYNGSTLSRGTTYHWRIKFKDNENDVYDWSDSQTFKINQPPTCSITAPPDGYAADIDEGIGFASSASDNDGDSLTYHWDFGDLAGTSSEQNPSYSYGSAGDYTATLYVSDGYEDSATASIIVSVGGGAPPPPPPGNGAPGWPAIPPPGEIVRDIVEPEKNVLFVPLFGIGPLTINPLIILIAITLIARHKKKKASGIMWACLLAIGFLIFFGSRLV